MADRRGSLGARLEHAAQTWSLSPHVALWQPCAVQRGPGGSSLGARQCGGRLAARWDRRHRAGLGCQSLTQRGQSPGAGAAQSLARQSGSHAEDAGGHQVPRHAAGSEHGAGCGGTRGTTCTPWGPAASLSWGHLCHRSKSGSWRGGSPGSQAPWPRGVPQPCAPVLHLPGPPHGIRTSCVPAPQPLQHCGPPCHQRRLTAVGSGDNNRLARQVGGAPARVPASSPPGPEQQPQAQRQHGPARVAAGAWQLHGGGQGLAQGKGASGAPSSAWGTESS